MRPPHSPLVGRELDVARIDAVVTGVEAGEKRGAAIIGPAGTGKTVLLRQSIAAAQARGFACATVRIPAGSPLPPHYPVPELLRSLIQALRVEGTVPPSLAALVAGAQPGHGAPPIAELTEAMEETCRAHRVALFIDDFHLTPSPGATLIMAATRAIDAAVAVIVTARTGDPTGTPVPEPTADLWFDTIEVGPLGPDAVATLAASMLGAPMLPTSAEVLYETTGGNPLHVVEALRSGLAEGWLTSVGRHWAIGEGFAPKSVLESVATRIGHLRPLDVAAGAVLAVIGRPATVAQIARAAGLSEPDTVEALASLADAGFVAGEESGPEYRLTHPLHRTALLDAAGPVRAASIHTAVLEGLRDGSAPAGELAHHATHAHSRPADLAALLHAAATEAESAGSPNQAAEWFGRLVEETRGDDRLHREALRGHARTTAQFDPGASVALFSRAIEGAGGSERAALLVQRARAYQRIARFNEALEDLHAALPDAASEDLFSIEAGIGTVHLLTGHRSLAEERFTQLARQSEGTPNHARALYHLAAARGYAGDLESCIAYSQRSIDESNDPHLARSARNNLIWCLSLLGRTGEAEARLEPAIAELEASGDHGSLFPLIGNAALMYGWLGDTVKALDLAVRSEAIAERIGSPTDRLKALECTAVALLEGGDPAGATSLLDEVRELLSGDVESREINYTYLVMGDAALAMGDTAGAAGYCDRADALLASDAVIWAEGIARLRAQIHAAAGDLADAWTIATKWIDDPGPVAIEHAKMVDVAGRVRHAMGERTAGRALVQQAQELYETIGASRRAGAARGWLVLNAARRAGRPKSTRPAGLTEREIEIIGLIVHGRSNRQIADRLVLSPATVKTHVERILAKTGAARRAELGMIAVKLGLKIPMIEN